MNIDLLLRVPCALDGLTTTNTTRAAGGDQTDLLAWGSVAGHRRGVTNVLMVTTTVGVLHGVTGHTTHLGPAVALATEAVERVTGLEDGLLNTATTGDDADHSAAGRGDGLLLAAGQLQASAARLVVVGDDDAVVTAGASKRATVARLGLDVAHDAALRDGRQGHDVANGQGGLDTAVHRLASEHTLRGNHELLDALVLVRVAELHASQGGTAASLVLNGLHNTTHEAVALGVVQNAELGGAQALVAVHLVHGTLALTAGQNGLTHVGEDSLQ
mmetsp:Transcript_68463/g.79754  ORF Transcript_68463/g.79754 Transcript_68463/m.79754 type:complete len:273 (-) Transcript_68463:6-824(-)